MFFGGVFTLVAMTGLDQDMMQRNLSCRSPRDSQINIVITAFSQMAVILLFWCSACCSTSMQNMLDCRCPRKAINCSP